MAKYISSQSMLNRAIEAGNPEDSAKSYYLHKDNHVLKAAIATNLFLPLDIRQSPICSPRLNFCIDQQTLIHVLIVTLGGALSDTYRLAGQEPLMHKRPRGG